MERPDDGSAAHPGPGPQEETLVAPKDINNPHFLRQVLLQVRGIVQGAQDIIADTDFENANYPKVFERIDTIIRDALEE